MRILIALRDSKTGSFLGPLTVATPGEAERAYQELLSVQGSLVSKYPGDFPLYEIGRYDELTGEVYPLVDDEGKRCLPRLLLEAAQLMTPRLEVEEVKRG